MELKDLPKCPVETTLKLIGEKWKILIKTHRRKMENTYNQRFTQRDKTLWRVEKSVLRNFSKSFDN